MKKSARKRFLAIFLTVCMALSLLPTAFAAAEEPFVDVPQEAWYFNDVEYVTQRGYFSGTGSGAFSPEAPMTRAMFVTVLARLDGAALDGAAAFDDVPAGTWYAGAVAWAVENDIASGVGGGLFAPEKPVTREQMAAIMARYIEYYAKKQNVTFEALSAGVGFTDAADISAFAAEAVGLCRGYGLISGLGDGRFAPKDDSTRAQVASVVRRLAQFLTTGTPVKDKPAGATSGGSSASATVKTAADFMAAANASADYVTATLQSDSFITVNDDIAITNDSVSVLTLDLGNAYAGNLTINSTSARTIIITGTKDPAGAVQASISSLTINAPNASVTNEVSVGGSVNIQAVSQNTFNNTGKITGNIVVTGKGAINDTQVNPVPVVIATDKPVAVKGNSETISVTAENANVTVNTVSNTKPTVSSTASGVTLTVATDMQVTLTGTMETVTATAATPTLKVDGTVAVVKAESANTLTLSGSGTIENVKSTTANAEITVPGETASLTVTKVEAASGATVTAPDNVIGTVAAAGSMKLETSVQTVEAAVGAIIEMGENKTAAPVEAKGNVTIKGSGAVGQIDAQAGTVTVADTASVTAVNNTGNGEVTLSGENTQNITVTKKAPKPTGITVTPATAANTRDTISGVNSTMEYKKVGADEWVNVTGDTITDISEAGDYLIRTKATGDAQASEPVTVTVTQAVGVSSAAIQGAPYVGQTLTAAANVDATGTLSYQWYAGNDSISGATGKTFTPTDAQIGKTIKVVITNYTNATQTSAQTANVTVDKTALTKLNAKAAEVQVGVAEKADGTTAAEVALGAIFVTTTEKTELLTAVASADAVEKNADADTAAVNEQVKALTNAINNYVKAKKVGTNDAEADLKNELATLISAANAAKNGVTTDKERSEEVEPGKPWVKPTVASTFATAITTATTVKDKTGATAEELSKAIADLNAALNTYLKAIREGAALDNSALTAAIAAAQLNAASVVVNTDAKNVLPSQNWVTQDAYNTYNTAITAAIATATESVKVAVQQENINALTALETATNTFNKAKQPGTKDIIAPIVTGVTVTKGESNTYTIKFTSNEAGTYACQLGSTEGTWPTGTEFSTLTDGKYSVSFEYELPVAYAVLYIQIQDTSGNATVVSVELGKEPTEDTAVAAIGSAKYETLAAAVAAAQSGQTVKLLKTTEGSGVKIASGSNLTIDLNGMTYTVTNPTVGSPGTETNGFQLLKDSNITFKNGTIKAGTSKILIQNYCNLILENVTLDARDTTANQYAMSNNFGHVTIKGNTNIYAKTGQVAFDVWYGMHSTYLTGVSVTFDDTFTGTVTGTIEYGADTEGLKDTDWRSKAALTIGGSGTFTGSFAEGSTGALNGANITITGGTFSTNPSDYVASATHKAEKVGETWKVVPLGAEDDTAVASVGTTYYSTLQAALAAAPSGATVTLLKDVTADDGVLIDRPNAEITLDLNGRTYTVNTGANVNNRAFKLLAGTLNVSGGTIVAVGSGTTQETGTGAYGAFRVEADGVLNLSNATLKNSRPWGLNVKVLGGEATLDNVTIESSYGGGIEVTEADLGEHSKPGSATLKNCNFTQTGHYDHASTTVSVSGGSTLNVESGTYTSENYGAYVYSSGGDINITGGTFAVTGERPVVKAEIDTSTYPQYTGALKISGGTFTGTYAIKSPASMSITGGTFSTNPSAYVASATHKAVQEGATWTVVPLGADDDTAVASVGTTYYSTLQAALAAAPSGETVKLLKDVTLPTKSNAFITYDLSGKALDLNNHTISSYNASSAFVGKDAVIKNGNFVCLNNGSYALFIGDECETDNFIVEGITTTGGINIYNASNVVIRSSNVVGAQTTVGGTNYYAVWLDQNAEATIEGGSYSTASEKAPSLLGVTSTPDISSKLTITGGNFTVNPDDVLKLTGGSNDKFDKGILSITGGTFSVDPQSYVADGYAATSDGTGWTVTATAV